MQIKKKKKVRGNFTRKVHLIRTKLWCFLSFNVELPQDPKSRASSFHAGSSGSEESLNTSSNTLSSGNLTKDQSSLSHPDLSVINKERAATLPARGFRTGKTSFNTIFFFTCWRERIKVWSLNALCSSTESPVLEMLSWLAKSDFRRAKFNPLNSLQLASYWKSGIINCVDSFDFKSVFLIIFKALI